MKQISAYIILCFLAVKAGYGNSQANASDSNSRAILFYENQYQNSKRPFKYNQYENIISGGMAFLVGNFGYIYSESSFTKISYAAIQTIGIINVGRGIYKLTSPDVDASFYKLLTDDNVDNYSKSSIAQHLLEISAKEARARRLYIFYSTSLLATQYFINALIYKSTEKVKNTYLFLGGINVIIAGYAAINKNNSEEYFFGSQLDLAPFAYSGNDDSGAGAMFSYRF
ncbi:MAG: hypothetical protein A2504_02155 [Bdellovibrionales bacterium RIFOXYD12_FULL_39_22]|nr:MAG: hypothetical protein A2385_12180 [Bdellovibrionales bacterium RIFOXYB1_FULL_39_21]OFZ41399.1 MAG: hypothetical protein A2485_01350 [Bdellovibrionales bacterium RIFOXYC12_FULL_39_17]OFZ45354.1 MAG: hypothetical protein A2404_13365 [Bdellovibrionales bacterium RIFOXYC1_FULL_39_130]OFZ74550.1 MAG: hypothetical protein A2560_12470 [Bdellovibrionales bacterium RIFOXYD1_FULL_39_84]OFZ92559.1 MAG: hypothetical protein A2504_02155 [Bdellovibrionales bacterium RIFOXYD12_FULL_39_22]HLE09703.1 hy